MRPPPQLLDWRPLHKNTLVGIAKVRFSSGLTIAEITVHRSGSRVWASPPARPWIENGALVIDERGRPRYQQIIEFANHGVRASWSRQVINALCEAHPDLFPEMDEGQPFLLGLRDD
jgi:hypothetical protein